MKLLTLQTLQHGRGQFITAGSVIDIDDATEANRLIARNAARIASKADVAAAEDAAEQDSADAVDGDQDVLAFTKLNVKKALAAIEGVEDLEKLSRYLAAERVRQGGARKSVIDALEAALGPDDDDDDE